MNRQEAEQLLDEWVENKNLKKHMYAVAQAMDWYARKFDQDKEKWWVVGLLHDMDYERYPNQHPEKAVEYLTDKLDQESVQAIRAHAVYTNEPHDTQIAKTLFAVDELTGFIVAVALIKPNKSLAEVDVNSVTKRLKEKRFAAAVNREEIDQGVEMLGISLQEHTQNVLDAMKEISDQLGL